MCEVPDCAEFIIGRAIARPVGCIRATAHDSLSGNDALIPSPDATLPETRCAGLDRALHHPVGGGEPVFHEARLSPCDQGMRRKGFEVRRDLRWTEFVLLVPAARRGRRQAVGSGAVASCPGRGAASLDGAPQSRDRTKRRRS
jgi:hypothetical protein